MKPCYAKITIHRSYVCFQGIGVHRGYKTWRQVFPTSVWLSSYSGELFDEDCVIKTFKYRC